jgi:hypothetical protein
VIKLSTIHYSEMRNSCDRNALAANVSISIQDKDFINTSMRGFTKPSSCCLNGRWIVIGSESQLIFGIVPGNRGQLSSSTNLENFYVDRLALAHIRAAVLYIQHFKVEYLSLSPFQFAKVISILASKRGLAHA